MIDRHHPLGLDVTELDAVPRRSFLAIAACGVGAMTFGSTGHAMPQETTVRPAPTPNLAPNLAPTPAPPPASTRPPGKPDDDPLFRISLAQWSLHRSLQSGALTNLDFPSVARRDHGVDAVEFVNTFFLDKAGDGEYLKELHTRCVDAGVRALLIMCDGLGRLGDPDDALRNRAVEAHVPWLHATVALGGHSIRVNADSSGERDEQQRLAADGLRRLAELAEPLNINVIVENHGGLSSDAKWLVSTLRAANHPRLGTLPDFGNFRISATEEMDRYEGVRTMMPLALAVSAKSHDFDGAGNERHTDYRRMMQIVLEAGYRGHVGIEYEGGAHSEAEGIALTRRLLEHVRTELAPQFPRQPGPA